MGLAPFRNSNVSGRLTKRGNWVRKPIHDWIDQYPLEVASERDDKVTNKSYETESHDWKRTGTRLRNEKPSITVSGSILSILPDMMLWS
jgi:hypothetical protein